MAARGSSASPDSLAFAAAPPVQSHELRPDTCLPYGGDALDVVTQEKLHVVKGAPAAASSAPRRPADRPAHARGLPAHARAEPARAAPQARSAAWGIPALLIGHATALDAQAVSATAATQR